MATPLVWKSLQNFATAFHYLWKCPLHWDKISQKLVPTKSPGLLVPWMTVVFILIPVIFVHGVVIIFLNIYGTISLRQIC